MIQADILFIRKSKAQGRGQHTITRFRSLCRDDCTMRKLCQPKCSTNW